MHEEVSQLSESIKYCALAGLALIINVICSKIRSAMHRIADTVH